MLRCVRGSHLLAVTVLLCSASHAQVCQSNASGTPGTNRNRYFQSAYEVTAGCDIRISQVSLLTGTTATSSALSVQLASRGANGLPLATLAFSSSKNVSNKAPAWHDFRLNTTVTLSRGTQFFIVLSNSNVSCILPETSGGTPLRALWRSFGFWTSVGTVRLAYRFSCQCRVRGSFTPIGRSCQDSRGNRPLHSGTGTPNPGNTISFDVSGGRPNAPAVMYFGGSKTQWGPFRLPLDVTIFGAGPGCLLYVSVDGQLPLVLDSRGTFRLSLRVAPIPGAHFYTQYLVFDRNLTSPLPLVYCNGLDTLVGGYR